MKITSFKTGIRFLAFICILILTFVHFTLAQSTWTESSFQDFRDGWFLDAGSNIYVSAKGRIQMINRWDFNNDGYLDILMPSGHGHTEKENTYIYLNNGKDIDARSRIELPGCGSIDGLVADFNKDGFNDIAIANSADSHYPWVNAWIYYGTSHGFSAENRTELPAFRGSSIAAGDFNGDGWLDLAIACQWQAGTTDKPKGPQMSFIYWNSPKGFQPESRLPLVFEGKGAKAFAAADLDKDGKTDLIATAAGKTYILLSSQKAFHNKNKRKVLALAGTSVAIGNINHDAFPDFAVCSKSRVVVFFGSQAGFSLKHSSQLSVDTPSDVVLADVNKDGFDDVVVANKMSPIGATWVNSYIFLSNKGELSNSSVIKLPTLAATGVSVGDLNGDGFPEVVFSNQRVTNQLNICSYVYWNDRGRFLFGDRTQLPTQGSVANCIGDVNNDGLPDVVFFNDEGYFRDGPVTSYIYWGDGTRNFSVKRRTCFYTHHIFGCGQADLDDDGYVDIILAQNRFVYRMPHKQNGLIICWGNGKGFSVPTRLTMIDGYGGMRIADINKDGYLDMVAGGVCVDLKDPQKHGFPIFWGSASGFYTRNRTVLHFKQAAIRGPLLMDLNKDGWLDIAGQVEDGKVKIWWGSAQGFNDTNFTNIDVGENERFMYIKGADFNKDGWLDLLLPKREPYKETNSSFIYYGSPNGFSSKNRVEIMSYAPYDNSIADFNKDGWLDIFLTSYGSDAKGNRPSLIHWGSPDGFDQKPVTKLPTYGASGAETADYDGDGWIDILVANHRWAGSYYKPIPHHHITKSMLYWGGPDGFSPKRRWEVQTVGPSGLNLRDVGNSYDRGLYEDYVSSAYKIAKGEKPIAISWKADTPHNTAVKFQIRVADKETGLASADWYGQHGKGSWYTKSGSKIKGLKGKWIQYRARLITPNGGATPYLTAVTIKFK